MRIEQMKNVDIRIVNPKSLVSVNFLTYTTCIKKCEVIKMRLLNIPKMYKEELLITQFSAKELQEIGVIEEI